MMIRTGGKSKRVAIFFAIVAAPLFWGGEASGKAAPIAMDGLFNEWRGVEVAHVDSRGDAASGAVDFQDLSIANDRRDLFIRIQLGVEVVLQESNRITLYIDTDDNAATGIPLGDMGADLSWTFGRRSGELAGRPVRWAAIGIIAAPSHSGDEFEISLSRDAKPGGAPLFPSNTIRLAFRDNTGGDRIPDGGASIPYSFDDSLPFDPEPISVRKEEPGDVRIMTYNVLRDGPWIRTGEHNRMLESIAPDIIALQEIYDHSGYDTKSWVISRLGGRWFQVWDSSQLHTLSRYPFLGAWVASPGRAWAALIDLPETFDNDLLLINVHLSCCGSNSSRQSQIDEVMEFIRDAKSPGGDVEIPRNTAIVILGDTNMYGFSDQVRTMLTGDIMDNETFGPDFKPDWDGTSFEALLSRQSSRRQYYTWYDEGSAYSPGHIDRITYSDSRLNVAKSFVLHTPQLDPAELDRERLRATDSPIASDHIPHVMDIRGEGAPSGSGQPPASSPVLISRPNPFNPATTITFQLEAEQFVSLVVYDAAGRLVKTLVSETLGKGPHFIPWEADDRLASGAYFARLKSGDRLEQIKITLVR